MPIYEYQCSECNERYEEFKKIDDRHFSHCPKCKSRGVLKIASSIGKDWFRAHWNEDISTDGPIYIESKRQYKEECKKNGCMARCLL